jgi:hypothetical protein
MKAKDKKTNEERGSCYRGHPWVEANMYTPPSGGTRCRLCTKSREKSRVKTRKPRYVKKIANKGDV